MSKSKNEFTGKNLAHTIFVLAGSCFGVATIILFVLYLDHTNHTISQLSVAAKAQAKLIESIARFNETERSRRSDSETNIEEVTLRQVLDAHSRYRGFGETGEFMLAELKGDSIVFKLRHRNSTVDLPKSISLNDDKAEPMRRALQGRSGVMHGLDYRGVEVLAAYEHVDILNMGIVAKIDLAEVYAPFYQAFLISIIATLIAAAAGAFLIFRSIRPLIQDVKRRGLQLVKENALRMQLEAELRASEKRLRSLLLNIGEGIIIADPDENFIYANRIAEEVFGVAHGELLRMNFREFVSPEQYAEIRSETEVRKDGSRTQYEIEIRRKDGGIRNILLTATPEIDNSGKLIAEFGIFRDITGKRESEALLRWLNKAVESAGEVIFMTDKDGVFIYVNPAFTRLYGYKAHDVIGIHTPRILNSRKQQTEYYTDFWDTLLDGHHVEDEIVNITADERLVTISQSVNAVKNEKGKVEAFLSVQKDITEQKMAEYQLMEYTQEVESLVGKEQELSSVLQQSLEELEASKAETEKALQELKVAQTAMVHSEKMASIGVLAAGIAHEINNPVGYVANNLRELNNYTNKIQSYLKRVSDLEDSIAEQDLESAKSVQKELEDIRRLQKLDFILEDLSDLISDSLQGTSNIETIVRSLKLFSRKDEDTMAPVNLNEIVENSIRVVHNQLKYRAEVVFDRSDAPEVWGQIGGLQQVFSNLLVNAAQAIEDRGTVTITIFQDGIYVVAKVADTGGGIAPENIKHIFEPFYTTKDVGKGTGLGLSIVFDIIKKHNGRIEVESELGMGTAFTVYLPIAASNDTTDFGEDS